MQLDGELLAGIVSIVFPCAFALFVLFSSRPHFPAWAKGMAIVAALSGITSATLSYVLLHHHDFGLSMHARFILLGTKHTLDGIVIGIVISVLFSCMQKRYEGGTVQT